MKDGESRCSESLHFHKGQDVIDTTIQTALLYLGFTWVWKHILRSLWLRAQTPLSPRDLGGSFPRPPPVNYIMHQRHEVNAPAANTIRP